MPSALGRPGPQAHGIGSVLVNTVGEEDAEQWRGAARLRDERPGWVMIWLARTREYRAYEDSQSRRAAALTAATAADLAAQIRQATPGPPMTTALAGGQEGWSTTRAPALIWRHMAPGRLTLRRGRRHRRRQRVVQP